MSEKPPASSEVEQWPEWIALARRLGIEEQLHRCIVIRLEVNQFVSIEREHFAQDTTQADQGNATG